MTEVALPETLPQHWESVQMKWLLRFSNGRDHTEVEDEDGTVPVYGSGGEFARATGHLYDGESVLFGRKGTVDRPRYVHGRFWTVDTMYYTRLGPKIDGRFLYYFATTIPYGLLSTSTALPSMTQSTLGTVKVPVPPISEQHAIADFLDRETAQIDAMVDAQERLVTLLEERRSSVVAGAVTRGLRADVPLRDSGIDWLGVIPGKWETARTRHVCDISTGSMDTVDADPDGDYPLFVRSPIVQRASTFTHDCEAVLTAGDGAGVGEVFHHHNGKFAAHQRVYIYSNFRNILPRYYFWYLSEMLSRVTLAGTAKSTVPSLRRPMLANLVVTVPPVDEQRQIVAELDSTVNHIDITIAKVRKSIDLMNERRAAVISAAVTGRINVRSGVEYVERELEEAGV